VYIIVETPVIIAVVYKLVIENELHPKFVLRMRRCSLLT